MIRKLFRSTVLMLVAVALAASVTPAYGTRRQADTSKKPPLLVPAVRPVYLRCTAEKLTKTEILLNIVNNTADTVPRGTRIYWQITQKVRGSFVLDASLASSKFFRRSVKPTPPGSEFMFNPQPEPPEPQAWYQKVHSGTP